MKKRNLYILVAGFAGLLAGCDKNEITQPVVNASGARLKVIHALPGLPAIDIFVDGTKVNPSLTSSVTDGGVAKNITTGLTYNTTFTSNEYSITAAGNRALRVATSTPNPVLASPQTVAPGSTVFSQTLNLEDTKYYSVFAVGYPNAPEAIVVNDVFPERVDGKAHIRFVQTSPNTPSVDLAATYTPVNSATPTTVVVTSGAVYKSVSPWIAVDVAPVGTSYVFQMRNAGTSTTRGTASTASTLSPGRCYTFFSRGLSANYPVPGTAITLQSVARPAAQSAQPEIYYNPLGLTLYTNR